MKNSALAFLLFLLIATNAFWFAVTRNLEHLYRQLDAELATCYAQVQK